MYGKECQAHEKYEKSVHDRRSQLCYHNTFVDQFTRTWDSNGVSEGPVLWILPNFKKKGPRASFTNLYVPIEVQKDAFARVKKGDDKIIKYVEAVNHLLKSHKTSINIAETTPEVG